MLDQTPFFCACAIDQNLKPIGRPWRQTTHVKYGGIGVVRFQRLFVHDLHFGWGIAHGIGPAYKRGDTRRCGLDPDARIAKAHVSDHRLTGQLRLQCGRKNEKEKGQDAPAENALHEKRLTPKFGTNPLSAEFERNSVYGVVDTFNGGGRP